jgi:predicted phage gp36 major capsid-like protein
MTLPSSPEEATHPDNTMPTPSKDFMKQVAEPGSDHTGVHDSVRAQSRELIRDIGGYTVGPEVEKKPFLTYPEEETEQAP